VRYDAESDDALLDRLARTGDARAFEALYARHTPALYAIAVRMTRDGDGAADAVHDAWLRMVETLRRFEHRSTVRTWLTGILVNCVREQLRDRRRQDSHDRHPEDCAVEATSSAPLDASHADPLDLEAAIAALPPRYREVLVLHDVEGFTHDEVAAILGVVPGTSKSQLARARQRVREMLASGIPRTGP
jgi:RNA polymerase sigma-70 factor (ECF subfamily)